jgi:flagellar export protein FliJ
MVTKDLHSLIRIRKWDVEEKQRALAALLRREEAVLDAQAALAAEMEREKAYVAKAETPQRTFAAYLERCDQRKEQIASALAEVRRLIEEAREELAESYRRLKTFEVTQEAREEAEAKEEDRREQMELDEIGLTLHRRKA